MAGPLWDQALIDRAVFSDDNAIEVVLTDPLGVGRTVRGIFANIGQIMDPESNHLIMGSRATFTVERNQLERIPEGVAGPAARPWTVETAGFGTFKVSGVMPDHTAQLFVLSLEDWIAA